MSASVILNRFSTSGAVPEPLPVPGSDGAPPTDENTSPDAPSPDSSPRTISGSVAWHYGDPLGEQRSAARGAVVVDRSDRAVIEIGGDERLSWLHTISSQSITDLPDRRSAENLSLDANGRVEEHFVLTDIDGVTWIDTEAGHGEGLTTFLSRMVFWAKAQPAARPDMKVLTLVGPDVLRGPIAELLEIDPDAPIYAAGDLPESHHEEEPVGFWRRMPGVGALPGSTDTPLPVVDVVIPEPLLLRWWDALTEAGARMAGTWAYDALRVAGARPRLDVDTDDRTIPHEVNWIGGPAEHGAVHLDKGCYRGQETVARVHNLGKAPRRLVLLHLDGSADERPVPGDQVTAGGRKVGRVGTVVDHFEYGPIALALVKRNLAVDTDLMVGEAGAVSARIDPDSYLSDDAEQAGRAAIEKLRRGPENA